MRNDLDDDTLEDIAGTSSNKMKQRRVNSLMAGVSVKIKGIVKKFFSSKKAILITTAGTVLFISLGAAGVFFFAKSPEEVPEKVPEKVKDTQEKPVKEEEVKKAAPPLIAEVVFEDMIVLKSFDRIPLKEGSGMKVISMNLSLELSDTRYKKEVHAMEDKIRQIITEQVEGMTGLELRNPEGKIMLKYELLKQMNSIFSEVMIRNIYFTNFLMQ